MAERRKLRLWRGLALIVLCLAGFAGAAVAGNPGNGNGNGNSANAPGQQGKTESQPASPQSGSQGNSANAPGHEKGPKPNKPASTAPSSSTAGEKVLVCHKTGSATNPYVVISISINGWINGHSKHPGDILLGPSFPGDHRKDASRCVTGGTTSTTTTTPTSTTTTGSTSTTTTSSTSTTTTGSTTTTTSTSTTGSTTTTTSTSTSTTAGAAAVQNSSGTGGALGAQAGSNASSGPLSGVLGATAKLGAVAKGGHLPFTGFPLWAAALVALVLIGLGLALRRRGRPFRA